MLQRSLTVTPDLKKCPFCGSKGAFGVVDEAGPKELQGGEFIECQNKACGASTCLMYPCMDEVKTLLAEKWNCRPLYGVAARNKRRSA